MEYKKLGGKTCLIALCLIAIATNGLAWSGSGTSEDPYIISNCIDLQDINGHLDDSTLYFELDANIDCSDTINWNSGKGFEPLGQYNDGDGCQHGDATHFSGNLDGKNYTISGLYIGAWDGSTPKEGLIGCADAATITNLGLVDFNVWNESTGGYGYTGGLIAWAVDTDISNVYLENGTIGTADTTAIGALIGGMSNDSNVFNCYQKNVSVYGSNVGSGSGVGGLIGAAPLNVGKTATIANTYSTGIVIGPSNYSGGLLGVDNVPGRGQYASNYWDMNVSGMITSATGTGLETTDMLKESSYDANWNFSSIWAIEEDINYPILKSFSGTSTVLTLTGVFNTIGVFAGGDDRNVSFKIEDSDNDAPEFLVDVNVNTSGSVGSGTVILNDANLSTAFINDTNDLGLGFDVNFYYLWTISNLDDNYYVCVNLKNIGAGTTTSKCSLTTFLIDSTNPTTSWDGDHNNWKNTDQNISLTCHDSSSGCLENYWRIDGDPTSGEDWGDWNTSTTINIRVAGASDGNYSVDFNSKDVAGNYGDQNLFFVLIDTNKPSIGSDINNDSWNLLGDANVHLTGIDNLSGIDTNYYRVDDDNSSNTNWGDWLPYDDSNGIIIDWASYGDGNFGIAFYAIDTAGNDSNTSTEGYIQYVLLDVNGPEAPFDISPQDGNYSDSVTITCSGQSTWIRDVNYVIDYNTSTLDWNYYYNGTSSSTTLDLNIFTANTKIWFRCKVIDADKNSIYFTSPTNIVANVNTEFDSISSPTPSSNTVVSSASAPFGVTAADSDGVAYCRFTIHKAPSGSSWSRIGDYNGTDDGDGTWSYVYTSLSNGDLVKADINCTDSADNTSSIVSTATYTVSISTPPQPPASGGGGSTQVSRIDIKNVLRLTVPSKIVGVSESVLKKFTVKGENLSSNDLSIATEVSDNIKLYVSPIDVPTIIQEGSTENFEWGIILPEGQEFPDTPIEGTIKVCVGSGETACEDIQITLVKESPLFGFLYTEAFGLPVLGIIIAGIVLFFIYKSL